MKFDCVIMNPPYQAATESKSRDGGLRNTIWQHFAEKSVSLAKENGYVVLIHPPRWRKPEDKTGHLLKSKNIKFLSIHDKNEAMVVFGCHTRYDWYILQNSDYNGKTIVEDENGETSKIDITRFAFLSHSSFDLLEKVMAVNGEKTCKVIYSRSAYGSDKPNMAEQPTNEFRYPCIHSTTKDAIRYWYSKTNKNGHFDVPKVIFGDSGGDTGISNTVVDFAGQYGLTQHAIGLVISSEKEGQNIKTAFESEKFTKLVQACNWGGFQIDWRMFKYFKKDFWKEFI